MDRTWSRTSALRGLCAMLGMASLLIGGVHAAEYAIAPAPSWVEVVERGLPDAASQDSANGGVHYLLADTQINAGEKPRAYFIRIASMAINTSGVESIANIGIKFDPSYEKLTLHSIDVIRGTQTFHKLRSARIQVLQRETALEAQIYDGGKTANIILDDVRVGDIVDYSYSLDGENPVFGGRIFNTANLQYGAPVARVRVRLRSPTARTLQMASQNLEMTPEIHELGNTREYVWDRRNVPPVRSDADTPGWYSAAAKVRWSEFSDWRQVVEWALPLYTAPADPGPEVRAEIAHIAKAHATPEARLRAVLAFVQSEVRYFGIEIGAASHAPSAPGLVLERRFGDCKDKTMLAVAMLEGLGVEARPALVNTTSERAVRDWLPSPTAFNHALVQARIGERTYWLDPTLQPQAGDLEHLVQPDYEVALVIDPSTRELSPMKNATTARSKRTVELTFEARGGFGKAVGFNVVTTREGADAEELRASLTTTSRDDTQRNYLNFYARYYPSIVLAAPLEIEDDDTRNRIVTREHYRIEAMAQWDDATRRHTADVAAPDIDAYLKVPQVVVRTAPLRVSHPVDVSVKTEILLGDGWNIKPSVERVVDPAFEFERAVTVQPDRVRLEDRFRTLNDVIAPGEVARYAANMSKALDHTNFQFHWSDVSATGGGDDHGGGGINGWMLFALLPMLAGCIWLGRAMYRYDPVVVPRGRARELVGLRGWLMLPAIGIAASPLVVVSALWDLQPLFLADTWWALTAHESSGYNPLWAPTILFSVGGNLMLLTFALVTAVLFFKRRSSVPRLYIGYLVISLVMMTLDSWLSLLVDPESAATPMDAFKPVIRQLWSTLLWGAYFARSDRVDATFTRRRDGRDDGFPRRVDDARATPEHGRSDIEPIDSPVHG